MPAGNPENLISIGDMTPERRREITSMGGKASAAKRRQNRTLREMTKFILSLDVSDKEKIAQLSKLGITPSYGNAVSMAQVEKATEGDTAAATWVRDTIGEKPTDKYNMTLDRKSGAIDLSKLSDAELAELADSDEEEEADDE